MRDYRKHVRIIIVILMAAFTFSIMEIHKDHDLCDVSHHCCVQCCPSHNLALAPNQPISLSIPAPTTSFIDFRPPAYSLSFPSRIDRPPIV